MTNTAENECFICAKELGSEASYIEARPTGKDLKRRHFCFNHYSEIAVMMNSAITEMLNKAQKEGGE